jgi:DNA-binding response OmpR family regulator
VGKYLGKVLLIDDSAEERMMLAEELRRSQWIVEAVANARVGVDAAMTGQPDVIVTTAQTKSLARTLRSCIDHDVVIVGLANLTAAERAAAIAGGFDEVFRKPVAASLLHDFLSARIGVRSATPDRKTTKVTKLRR